MSKGRGLQVVRKLLRLSSKAEKCTSGRHLRQSCCQDNQLCLGATSRAHTLRKKLLVFIRHLSLGRYCGYSCSALRGLIFLLGAANRAHTKREPAHQVVEIAKVTSSAWVLPAGRTPGENSWYVLGIFRWEFIVGAATVHLVV